jgi:hypothetical protein
VRNTVVKADDFAEILQREISLFVKAGAEWFKAFLPILYRSRDKPGTSDFLSASMLHVQYLTSVIPISLSIERTEFACDQFLTEYITIIDYTEDVLKSTYRPCGSLESKSMFAFDCSLVWSLKIVATKCRDREVRRRAIMLIRKFPTREGFRVSEMAAAITTWLMNKEEEGVLSDYIPEEARLRVVRTKVFLDEWKALIVCSRLIEGSEKREELPEAIVTW